MSTPRATIKDQFQKNRMSWADVVDHAYKAQHPVRFRWRKRIKRWKTRRDVGWKRTTDTLRQVAQGVLAGLLFKSDSVFPPGFLAWLLLPVSLIVLAAVISKLTLLAIPEPLLWAMTSTSEFHYNGFRRSIDKQDPFDSQVP